MQAPSILSDYMDVQDLLTHQISAFTLPVAFDTVDTQWSFTRHHLVYASTGLFRLEVDDAIWRLPPSRAAWIPSGVHVHVTSRNPVRGISVFFHSDFVENEPFRCRVFPVSPLAREMLLYSRRWSGIEHQDDENAEQFYGTLAFICRELYQNVTNLYLPKPKTVEITNLFAYIEQHIDQPLTLDKIAAELGLSKRTISRRLHSDIHLTWSELLHRTRMLRAMELLADGYNVTETTLSVGFQSLTSFSSSFRKFTGMSPSQYQKHFA